MHLERKERIVIMSIKQGWESSELAYRLDMLLSGGAPLVIP